MAIFRRSIANRELNSTMFLHAQYLSVKLESLTGLLHAGMERILTATYMVSPSHAPRNLSVPAPCTIWIHHSLKSLLDSAKLFSHHY